MNTKILIFSVLLLSLDNVVPVPTGIIPEYVYKFGNEGIGTQVYTKKSWIGWPRLNTEITLPVTENTDVTFVKVTVTAINPPKVEYDEKTRTVSIHFSLNEFSGSSYDIYAEGIRVYVKK